jgi:hypothetical protein
MKRALLIGLIFTLIACEGSRMGDGIVYDELTNEPIDSVAYKRLGDNRVFYTDSTGQYFINGEFGGCLPDCPDFSAEFVKPGYKTKRIDNPDGDIYLEIE